MNKAMTTILVRVRGEEAILDSVQYDQSIICKISLELKTNSTTDKIDHTLTKISPTDSHYLSFSERVCNLA